MKYVWDYVLISWLLVKFRVLSFIPAQSNPNGETFPISSPRIQLACDNGLRVNNIEVALRRSNTTCLPIVPECTLPNEAIEIIKEKCNKQESCDVDIRNITSHISCLQEYGYFNVWYTCKTILDYSCDFESDLCHWSSVPNNDRFQWKHGLREKSKTPTIDHTTASTMGRYAYIHANFSRIDNTAMLESGYIIGTEQQCFSFWYFTTNYRDSVRVYLNEDNLYELSDYEKGKWHHIYIPLGKSKTVYKLVFKVIRENFPNSWYGAIVIDDILIENRNCKSSILFCDFENNSCDWQTDEQKLWQKQHGEPEYPSSGPSTDHTTTSESGYYMYLGSEADDFPAGERIASFEFHNVELDVPGNYCLTFWYHMYRSQYGTEELNVKLNDDIVWTEYGKLDNQWEKGTIDLHSTNNIDITFLGILGSSNLDDIAIDDILLTYGTCNGLIYHEEACVHSDINMPKETSCPKDYLDFQNPILSFDPERDACYDIYNQINTRLRNDCDSVHDSQKCLIDPSTDISSQPECFQLYEFRILHTCEEEETSTVTSDISSGDSSAGLTVGLVIGALLLICAVIVMIILIRRHTFKSNPREKIRKNLGGNDYIGSQAIALPLTANHSRHMQNTGLYNGSSDTSDHAHDSTNAHAHNNNVQHEYTNVVAVNGLVNNEVQVPIYAHRKDKTFADKHMSNEDEYVIVDHTAETSFNENMDNRTETADSYRVLDPTKTGSNRQIISNTPLGYELAKPLHDTETTIMYDDQYAISDGVYDHSGNNRHKESDKNIYNHTVDTIYDSGSHKRNEEGKEDAYDHFFGQTTEDDYDISTTT